MNFALSTSTHICKTAKLWWLPTSITIVSKSCNQAKRIQCQLRKQRNTQTIWLVFKKLWNWIYYILLFIGSGHLLVFLCNLLPFDSKSYVDFSWILDDNLKSTVCDQICCWFALPIYSHVNKEAAWSSTFSFVICHVMFRDHLYVFAWEGAEFILPFFFVDS